MTQALLDYLKQLCIDHADFRHDDASNRAYFEFDYKSMTEARQRNKYVLFVNKLQGKYNDNKGDYKTDQSYVTALFLVKMESKNLSQARQYFLECKTHMDQFLRKMEYDRENSLVPSTCKLLRHVDYDEITWEFADITNDLWTGVQMRIPFRYELTAEYDPSKWT